MVAGRQAAPAALSGAERVAIVLRELGEDIAIAVMRQMDETAIGRITGAMARLNRVSADAREEVLRNFEADLGGGGLGEDALRYINRVLVSALGEVRAQEIFGRLSRGERAQTQGSGFAADPRTLAMQMAGERPQTLALLLAQLPHETGAAMLSFLPEPLAAEAIYRFTTLDAVSPEAVRELREMMSELANSEDGGKRLANLGGAKQAADILNHLQIGLSERMMGAIEQKDHETAEKIRENLFTFLDLSGMSDRMLQIVLREVPSDRLAPALRLADEAVRQRFFQNMSVRTAEVLQEELRSGPPIRSSEAIAAQSEILEIALRLAAEGRIAINATEEMV
ncbi:MAG: flagellar motor switch protein FliG [Acidocella sp. 20-61-6]|nr:MAG: flagellar motor switch protein FliG [Acidocella sp. 20-61-6]